MRVPIILLAGQAGAGKDATADMLCAHYGAAKVAQSDPMKRLAKTLFQFTDYDLWGPSGARDVPAFMREGPYVRGPHPLREWLKTLGFRGEDLSVPLQRLERWFSTTRFSAARDVLQTLGTEWGRSMDPDLWIDHALKSAKSLLGGHYRYEKTTGRVFDLFDPDASTDLVVIPDGRFRNEILRVREVGGVTVRIVSEGAGLTGPAAQHASETALTGIPAGWFDYTLVNDRSAGLDGLHRQVDRMMRYLG